MSVAILPQRQIVSSAASSSVRRCVTSTRMSVANGRASGSSVRASKSTATNRRARSSETVRPLPVRITNADAFNGTICDRPSSRTRAGRSVIALASRSDLKAVLFRLSRNRAGLPSINSAAIRFSSSSAVCTGRHGVRLTPEGNDADAAGEQTLAGAGTRHGRCPQQHARARGAGSAGRPPSAMRPGTRIRLFRAPWMCRLWPRRRRWARWSRHRRSRTS